MSGIYGSARQRQGGGERNGEGIEWRSGSGSGRGSNTLGRGDGDSNRHHSGTNRDRGRMHSISCRSLLCYCTIMCPLSLGIIASLSIGRAIVVSKPPHIRRYPQPSEYVVNSKALPHQLAVRFVASSFDRDTRSFVDNSRDEAASRGWSLVS